MKYLPNTKKKSADLYPRSYGGADKFQAGLVSIVAILLVGIFLSMVLTLSAIFIPKLKSSSDVKKTSAAFYAAESAVEWCIYVNRKTPPSPTPQPPVMNNMASFTNGITGNNFAAVDCLSSPIKSIGNFQNLSRSLEVNL